MSAPSTSHAEIRIVTAQVLGDRLSSHEAAAILGAALARGESMTYADIMTRCGCSEAYAKELLDDLKRVFPDLTPHALPSTGGRPPLAWCAAPGQFS